VLCLVVVLVIFFIFLTSFKLGHLLITQFQMEDIVVIQVVSYFMIPLSNAMCIIGSEGPLLLMFYFLIHVYIIHVSQIHNQYILYLKADMKYCKNMLFISVKLLFVDFQYIIIRTNFLYIIR
jgi:hypothetical protein